MAWVAMGWVVSLDQAGGGGCCSPLALELRDKHAPKSLFMLPGSRSGPCDLWRSKPQVDTMSDEMGALAEDLKVSTLPHFQFFKVRACVRAHVCVRMCLCECVCEHFLRMSVQVLKLIAAPERSRSSGVRMVGTN